MTCTIIVIDASADPEVGRRLHLEHDGFTIHRWDHRELMPAFVGKHSPDLMLLGIAAPDHHGLELLRAVRRQSAAPIIVVSAVPETWDVVNVLECGADDFVVVPCSAPELLERIKARLRRSHTAPGQDAARVGFNPDSRQVHIAGTRLNLTEREYHLFDSLYQMAPAVLSRTDLLRRAWGITADVQTRTVDFHIARLRRKLAGAAAQHHLITVTGRGFAWDPG